VMNLTKTSLLLLYFWLGILAFIISFFFFFSYYLFKRKVLRIIKEKQIIDKKSSFLRTQRYRLPLREKTIYITLPQWT
jgi:hypothetical protein